MAADLLQTIAGNLRAAKPSGAVPLDTTTLTGAGTAIVKLFTDRLGVPSVLFDGSADVELDDGALTVTGPGSQTLLGIPSPALEATLTIAPDPATGADTLQLTLSVASTAWQFAKTFPQLATTSLANLSFGAAATFVLRTDDGPADAYGVLEPAGLSLETTVAVADVAPLDALDPILKLTQSTLTVAGPVTTAAKAESLVLRTHPGPSSIALPVTGLAQFSLAGAAVLLRASAGQGLDDTWTTAVAVEAWGVTTLGGSSIVLAAIPPVGVGAWRLAVVTGLGVRLTQLLGVVPGLDIVSALPDGVQQAVNAEVTDFAFLLSRTNGSWSPGGLSIAVANAAPWTIVQGFIALDKLSFALDVAFTGGKPQLTGGSVGGALELGSGDSAVEIHTAVPIPVTSGKILVWSTPDAKLPGLGALAQLLGGTDLAAALPPGFAEVGAFRLQSLAATIDPAKPTVTDVGIGLRSDPWPIIPDRLVIQGIWVNVGVANPFSAPAVTGTIGGSLALGSGSDAPTASVVVQRWDPKGDWTLNANVENVVLSSLGDLTKLAGGDDPGALLPASVQKQPGMKFTLVDLGIQVDLSAGTFELLVIQVAMSDWQVAPGYFAVEQVTGALTLDWRSGTLVPTGSISAVLVFGNNAAQLLLKGERDQKGNWTLSGTLTDDVDLIDLVGKALGLTPPSDLGKLVVSPVSLTYRTADDSYDFSAAAKWTPQIASVSLELDASVELHRKAIADKKPAQFSYSGTIGADLGAHVGSDSLALSVGYVFQTQNSSTSYVFGLKFNQLSLTGTYSKRANADEIVTVRLGGVSFGDIVTYLVDLADPSAHFSLSAPWDVLNKIRFDDLSLVVNLTQRSVGVTYAVNKDLGLIDIGTIGLTYLNKGGSGTVEIELTGSFLDQKYTPDQPLGWDLLHDDPPTPSGQGTQLFDLQLLGIGQHLVLADPGADTMAKVIDDLSAVVEQTTAKGAPKPWEILKFDPSAGWLFAADFTVMETVRLRLVFDDPVLYGVEITLSGDKAGPLAGLDFEILYRKLSDSLGVYHIALTLPDAMRHLEFGEVSVTLPNVVVDIYTDGSFYLDFGFPYNNDWTVCFGVQVFPFLGSGGFYFGKLSTAAAAGTDLVPKATNGTFGPVIEFGVALQLGVGKTFSEGPLSAGLSVTVQGIVTGVVSWFNPTDASQGSDQYYRIEGTVAVVGQLYGKVDFKVICIDISIVASASVSLTVESYQPIHIGMSLDVEVQASIKIVFFTIHFSFGLHLDASFTIGSAQATPWQLAATGSGTQTQVSLAARRRAEESHHVHAAARGLLVAAVSQRPALDWAAVPVMGATPVPIEVELMPFLTPAGDGDPVVQVVMAAFVQTSAPAAAGHDEWRTAVGRGEQAPAEMPFNVIAAALLKWGMQTLIKSHAGPITAVDLHLIYEDLCSRAIGQGGFAYSNVAAFLADNLTLVVVPPPAAADSVARAVLPMPPPLQMQPPGQVPPVKFWETVEVDANYQEKLQEAFDQLQVNYDYNRSKDPLVHGADTALAGDGDTQEPITEALFGDWFLMVARSVVQSAINLLEEHEHELEPTDDDSLADLAALFAPDVSYTVQQDDTAASIAALFGITTTQLLAKSPDIEPGKVIVVPPPIAEVEYVTVTGDTLATIAGAWHVASATIEAANPGVDFTNLEGGTAIRIPVPEELLAIADANAADATLAAQQIPLAGLRYQVRAGDTLGSVAAAYFLPDASSLGEANAGDPGVLGTGAPLTVAQAGTSPATIPYTSAADDTLAVLAAMLLVRNLASVEQAFDADPSYNWLANAISVQNPGVVFTGLEAGVPLQIPNVVLGDKGLEPNPLGPALLSYTTKPGDTLPFVAATFVMTELRPADPTLVALEQAVKTLNPNVDWTGTLPARTALKLPAQVHPVAPGDTLGALADRFWLTVADLALVNAGVQLLAPTASLALPPGLTYHVAGGTLAALAATLGLTTDALVGRIGAVKGLFATPQALKIRGARQADVDHLVQQIVDGGDANSAAGQASSFLLQGLRVPVPGDPATHEALFELTQQQFAGPPTPQEIAIAFTAPGGEAWLDLAGGTVTVTMSEAQMTTDWPSTTLDPEVLSGYPQPLPLGKAQAVRHPVATPIPWAVPAPPALSGPLPPPGGGPVLFPLPSSLTARVAGDPTQHPYALSTAPKGQQTDPQEVPTYSWATWVPFTVRRVPAEGGGSLEGAYVAVGADQSGADTLLELWTYLQATGGSATLYLAYPAVSGTGLVSDALGPGTALIKVNLSTETHSPPAMLAALVGGTPAPATYATLGQAQQFVQLLWEATITGTGGFYLTYDTATHAPLPDAVFSSGEDAQLTLVALLDDQMSAGERTLHGFTTGALVEGNLDTSRLDVFAQATDGSDMTEVAIVPPGNVGYVLERTNPSPVGTADPSALDRTRALYSMLAFTLTGDLFENPPLVLPTGPANDGDPTVWSYDRAIPVFRLVKTPPPALPDALPDAATDPYAGVAAGSQVTFAFQFRDRFGNELGGDADSVGPIDVGYYDPVLGLSAWPGASGAYTIAGPDGAAVLGLTVDLALTKYVPSPGNLFAAAVRTAAAHQTTYGQAFFQLRRPDVECSVATSLDPPGSTAMASAEVKPPLVGFAAGAYVYLGVAQSVQQAEMQVPQSPGTDLGGLAGQLFVTPGQLAAANAAADASQLFSGPLDIPVLHVVKASETLAAIADAAGLTVTALLGLNEGPGLNVGAVLQTAVRTYTAAEGDTLTSIAALEQTTAADLAVANSTTAGLLTAQTVTIDGFSLTIAATDTFTDLASKLAGYDPGITVAGAGTLLANVATLFAAGRTVAIASSPVSPDDTTGARTCTVEEGETLAAVAARVGCTALGLALANGQRSGVLDPAASVDVQGVTVPVGQGGTFVSVVEELRKQNLMVGIADVATAIEGVPNKLVENAELAVVDHVVQKGDTIATVPALSVAVLSLFDAAAPANVFAPGTPLVVGSSTYQPQAGDTLAGIAGESGLTLEQLAGANMTAKLAPGAAVAVPGAVTLPDVADGGVRQAPYQVPFDSGATPTIASVASTFDADAGALGTVNADMPGLLVAGVTIDYPGHSVTTDAASTLGSLAREAGVAVDVFTADPSVSQKEGLVAPGALFVAPLPPTNGSLDDLAQALGVLPIDLAVANSALIGLVAPSHDFEVTVPTTPPVTVTVTSGPSGDTLQSIVRRVQATAPSATIADLVASCGADPAALVQGVEVIVPPAPVALSASLGEPVRVPSTFAPLEVTLTVARDPALVDPEFVAAAEVAANATTISPALGDPPSLVPFATAFEAAFLTRRLKLATGPQPAGGAQRLWVVDFGPGGLAEIAVQGEGARFYAVTPMSRTLASGTLPIQPYDPATGGLGPAVDQTFASADLDSWMRIALGAIDLMLSPAVAASAWRVDPASLDSIVASKQTIAGALRDRVGEILASSQPDPGALASAGEALYQGMLVSLASAYTTDAVVTYPVSVQSPFTAPYTTGASDGFAELARAYGVSPEGVAQGLADIGSILAQVTVVVGATQVPIVAGETLREVAAAGGCDVTALPGLVKVPPDTPLFAPQTTIAQSAMTRTVAAGDTFATLGTYFGSDAGSVGLAAQDVPDLIVTGRTLTVEGAQYTVRAGDRLRTVAAALSAAAGHPIAAETVAAAPGIVDDPTLLSAGASVHCFSPVNTVPPRLSGKANAAQYQVQPGDGIAALVAWYGVSEEALVDALASAQILNAGGSGSPVTATWSGRTVTIAPTDTLTTLAAALGAPDVLALLAGITIEPQGAGLLRPGVRIPLGKATTTPVTASASFASLAAYFEDDPGSFAVANQARPGVLVPEIELKLGTQTYKVGATDTLVDVANGLGTTPRALAVAAEIGDLTGIFAASPVYDLQVLPEFSLSSAKTPLADGTNHVAVLFGTNADASFKSLFLDVEYDVAEIELDIQNIPGAGDYQASDWLRLVVPLGTTAFGGAVNLAAGQTEVPIPLRAFPLLPSVVDLSAEAAYPQPSGIEEAKQWDLMAAVQHQSAAQDEIQLEVAFGTVPPPQAPDAPPALFGGLAQFVTAWTELQSDLAALAALPAGTPASTKLQAVVGTLATLAGDVATALTQTPQLSARDAGGAQLYQFSLEPTIDHSASPPVIELFDLTLASATETSAVPWPEVYLTDPKKPLRRVEQPDGSWRYFYDEPPQAFASLTQHYVFPDAAQGGRDAVAFQTGQAAAAVLRNADLVTTAQTAAAFLYQTPWISFSSAAVPLLQTATPIQIGTGASIDTPLQNALTQLLTYDGEVLDGPYTVRILVTYERTLTGGNGSGAIAMSLPVLYIPQYQLSGSGIPALGDLVGTQASTWFSESAIQQHPGDTYVVDLAIFATADPSLTRPLVETSRLTVPLA